MELHDLLTWRYATKRMTGQKVPEDIENDWNLKMKKVRRTEKKLFLETTI